MRSDDVSEVLAEHAPDYRIGSVTRLGEGLDNVVYTVNDELIVRFAKEPDPVRRAELVAREARLLAVVAEVSPLPTPRLRFTDPARGCLAYRMVPGTPLLDLPSEWRAAHATAIGTALGDLLSALHAVDGSTVLGGDPLDIDCDPLEMWRADAEELYRSIPDAVPVAYRSRVDAFFLAPPPPDVYPPVFSHNDLNIEHVLVDVDSGAITGIIDWSDTAMVDPAYDIGLLYRDLGPVARDAILAAYRGDHTGLCERAVFYARCSVFEDLEYGLEPGHRAYLDKSLAALEWLFPVARPAGGTLVG